MRVLFTTRGSSGHVGPLVPFARACERAGHEVTVAAQEEFAANVERAGLTFAPFDSPAPELWMPMMGRFAQLDFESRHAVMVGEFFAGLDVAAELPRLTEIVERRRPDVIVRETWEFASTLVAELHGIPIARVALGLNAIEADTVAIAASNLDEAGRSLGLPADPDGDRLREAINLTMVPGALEEPSSPTDDVASRFRFPSADELKPLPDWWSGDSSPLVYLTFGSVAAGAHLPYYPDLYRRAIDDLAPLPIRLLLTIGDADRAVAELGALPPNVHAETWVGHDDAAAAADVVVCHGGFGSILGTLSHGTPLVVMPIFSLDQWANGEAVSRSESGLLLADDPSDRGAIELPSDRVLGGLAGAVERVLEDDVHKSGAETVATAMRALPTVDRSVDLLEGLVGPERLT